ncbi:hypothetical protein [Nostoc sp.]
MVILPCYTALYKCMGRTRTTWESRSTWNGGETTTIRIPIVLKSDILAYARAVDFKLISDKSRQIPMLKGDFLSCFHLWTD